MRLSYVLQLKDFSILLLIGFFMGIIYGLIAILPLIKGNVILRIITDFLSTTLITIVFIITVNLINLGEFRFFLLAGYLVGIVLERLTLGKLFAKGYKSVYNKLVILCQNFRNSKLGKVLFK